MGENGPYHVVDSESLAVENDGPPMVPRLPFYQIFICLLCKKLNLEGKSCYCHSEVL